MKFTILALFLLSCIFIDNVKAVRYREKYCNGMETVEGDKASLRCHSNWIKFIFENDYFIGHIELIKNDPDTCKRFYHILRYPQFYGKLYESQEVTESLRKFGVKECGSDEGEYTLTKLFKNIRRLQQ
uniref:Uncharacterized protein n=1 Tax=Amphimedon queenslandica TaxID=400682 RepID=A0A1X7U414_AMPQE